MDNLNKYHQTKTTSHKFKCEKTNNEITHESFNYDNCPSEFVPLLVNAIKELQERIGILESKIGKLGDNIEVSRNVTTNTLVRKKPLIL
jgi:hypothetical protein